MVKASATYDRLDPKLEAIWDATSTPERYVIAGERHVLAVRGDRRYPVPLAEIIKDETE